MKKLLPRFPLMVLALVAALLCSACGYSTSSLVSTESSTIAVPVFDNTTRRHDLEYEVTRAVVEELQARTHLVVVPETAGPDLVLTGTLVDVDETSLSRKNRQRPRDAAVFLTAEIAVRDARTGDDVVASTRVTERESYSHLVGEDLRTSREEAVRALAERIVRQLEQGW